MALAQFIVRLWMTARLGASVFAANGDSFFLWAGYQDLIGPAHRQACLY
jgi:hypothetical protein